MKNYYSTAGLARIWGVSESTIKRWADSGLLNCHKTAGGHRKFDPDDVLEFQRRTNISETSSAGEPGAGFEKLEGLLEKPDIPGLSAYLLEAALLGQEDLVAAILNRTCMRGVPLVTVAEEIVAPAMHEIGNLWRAGKAGVLEEHVASLSVLNSLATVVRTTARKSCGRLAVVGCPEGEFHQIASALVRYLLEEEGWRVIYLGPHTPFFSFADAVEKHRPELVCISTTVAYDLERMAREYEAFERTARARGAGILLGGAALADVSVRERFHGARYIKSFQELLRVVRSWNK